jgi:uncharacterized membrane protein YkvA (DUF1232 family)
MSNVIPYDPKERKQNRSWMRSLLTFLPNLVKLLYRLVADARVSKADKAVLIAVAVYVISPIDLIPDFFPFIGEVDDIYLVAIALLRLINRADSDVINEHWEGSVDIKALVTNISNLASFFLPKKVRSLLIGSLDRPAEVTNLHEYLEKREKEQPQEVEAPIKPKN